MTSTADAALAAGGRRHQPPPRPGRTADDFLRLARDLRPYLRDEQAATEERTYYSSATHEIFKREGFYRMLQPQAFGGYELSVSDFYRVIIEIARGCPSTGWCLCLGSAHVVNLAALFPAEVQAEVMGGDGHFVGPSRIVPGVRATPAEGGWLLNGVWDYCSGAPYSTHAICAVTLPPGADGLPRMGTALVPRDRYTVLDDWGNLLGLRGSGSHSIKVEDAVVPEGYVTDLFLGDIPQDRTYGMAVHGNPMYTGRVPSFFFGELLAVAIGMVRATLDEYREALDTKRPMWAPATLRRDDVYYQQWYGDATIMTDAAEAALLRAGDQYLAYCARGARGGGAFSLLEDGRLTSLTIQGGRQLADAMDLLFRTGGSSWLRDGSRTQRYWRDFSQYRSHVACAMREANLSAYTNLSLQAEAVGTGKGATK